MYSSATVLKYIHCTYIGYHNTRKNYFDAERHTGNGLVPYINLRNKIKKYTISKT